MIAKILFEKKKNLYYYFTKTNVYTFNNLPLRTRSNINAILWLHTRILPSRFVSIDKLGKIWKKPDEFVHMRLVTQQFWDRRWLRIRATIWAAGTSPYPGILRDKRLDPIKALITSVARPTCSPFLFLRKREFTHE